MAYVAIAEASEGDHEVAVARYVRLPDRRGCEFAIAVADAWQRRGLGELMMRRLIETAREAGLERMEGQVLAANVAMLELCRRLGFTIAHDQGDALERRVVLDL